MSATTSPTSDLSRNGNPGVWALLRLAASGGRSDWLRITLTATGSAAATITLLTAAAVAFISPDDGPYGPNVLDEPGLRPGVLIAILMLCVPLVIFVGLCTRVGAPARDRRLATFRLAGATPRDTIRIASFETGLAALFGALIGSVVFFVGRIMLDSTTAGTYTITSPDGTTTSVVGEVRSLPTDVHIPLPAALVVVAAIVIGATIASAFALRKVRISPFGITRTMPTAPPSKTAATLFIASAAGVAILGITVRAAHGNTLLIALGAFGLLVMCVAGLLMGSASISFAAGGFLAPRTSRPDLLIASRRMIAAPYTSSRATTSVLLAVLIGSVVQGTRANFLASTDPTETFYADTFALIDAVLVVAIALSTANLLVTAAEAIVERRRTLAALAAGGTPRSVLARAAILESLVPLVPSVVLASMTGLFAARAFFGTTVQLSAIVDASEGPSEMTMVDVPVPWARLAVLCGGTVAASAVVTALSLIFLARSTRPSEIRTTG